jgi:hypothetical protein
MALPDIRGGEKGLDLIMLINAWWIAITRGYPPGDLPQRCETAAAEHERTVARLDDKPLVGTEVRELRVGCQAESPD